MKYSKLAMIFLLVLSFPLAFAAQNAPVINKKQMDQRFEQMQTMMNRAKSTRSTAERRKLLQQHMGMMSEQMRMMRDMMGMRGMMGMGGMMGSNGADYGKTMQPPSLEKMQERMDMMQNMMGQMLEQQQMMMKRLR